LVIRFVVTLLIIVPLMLVFRGEPWYVTFLIALAGFGTGHLVELVVKRATEGRRRP
jgi:hypothetical protein